MLHREERGSGEPWRKMRVWFARCGLEAEDMRREVAEALRLDG